MDARVTLRMMTKPTLYQILIETGARLGLTEAQLDTIIGASWSKIPLGEFRGERKESSIAFKLMAIYRCLFRLVGGDEEAIHHWLHSFNRHTRGVPYQQIQDKSELDRVFEYLVALTK